MEFLFIYPACILIFIWLSILTIATYKVEKFKQYFPLAWRLLLWIPIGFIVFNGILALILLGVHEMLTASYIPFSLELEITIMVIGFIFGPYFFSFAGMLVGGLWAWRGYRRSKCR